TNTVVELFRPLVFAPCVTLTSVEDFKHSTPARTPRTRGPVLKYGPANEDFKTFLGISSTDSASFSDHIRISGFRLEGPTPDQQSGEDVGIRNNSCIDVEISNMEISGWGHAGIAVQNDSGRIVGFDEVRIHDNFIHHNRHPSIGGHALGYGVLVGSPVAW